MTTLVMLMCVVYMHLNRRGERANICIKNVLVFPELDFQPSLYGSTMMSITILKYDAFWTHMDSMIPQFPVSKPPITCLSSHSNLCCCCTYSRRSRWKNQASEWLGQEHEQTGVGCQRSCVISGAIVRVLTNTSETSSALFPRFDNSHCPRHVPGVVVNTWESQSVSAWWLASLDCLSLKDCRLLTLKQHLHCHPMHAVETEQRQASTCDKSIVATADDDVWITIMFEDTCLPDTYTIQGLNDDKPLRDIARVWSSVCRRHCRESSGREVAPLLDLVGPHHRTTTTQTRVFHQTAQRRRVLDTCYVS